MSTNELDYDVIELEEKPFAERLAYWISNAVEPTSVLDIGCGPGMHVYSLRKMGITAYGIDADPRVAGKRYLQQLSVFDNTMRADLTLCLEVAEHIEPELEDQLVAKVVDATMQTLIWSAAAVDQGGVGHINCKDREEWAAKLEQAGLVRNHVRERELLTFIMRGYHMGWFANNMLYFERPKPT